MCPVPRSAPVGRGGKSAFKLLYTSSGGLVSPPLSAQSVLDLSDGGLFRLFHHYNDTSRSEVLDERLVGGREQVQSVLREACSRHPKRFLALFPRLTEEHLHHGYIHAIVDGIATHLLYRFGNLRPSDGWKPIGPAPDGDVLAIVLLNLLERYPIIWEHGWSVSHAVQACCGILDDPESAERLTFLLFPLLRAEHPSAEQAAKDGKDLAHIAINSTRGVAAESAMILCNNSLKKDCPLPSLLLPILRHYARDPAISVRVSILRRLPYLIHKRPELGWQLLADVFREPQTQLWGHAEHCFYYQYHDHFDKVRPYLDRLWQEGMEEAGGTWGRISTLASLAGHISQEQLFATLAMANESAWQGTAEVFSANLDQHAHTAAYN